jgi:hypothetical protein
MTNATNDTHREGIEERFRLLALGNLRTHRRRLLMVTMTAAVAYAAAIAAASAWLPARTQASLDFVVTLEGATETTYPSGAAFVPEDVIAAPVLEQVFSDNGLSSYGNYWSFRNAFSVIGATPDVDLLVQEYRARLAEPRLSSADRARIEDEFRRRRELLSQEARHTLRFRRDSRFRAMPVTLVQKTLLDVLATWARQAEMRKGAITYNIAVFSKSLLRQEALGSEEYLVAADLLRVQVGRVLANIDQIAKIPGAELIRVGPEAVSLAEVRANLEDTQRFVVQPLIGLVAMSGLARDPKYLLDYFDDRLAQIEIDRRAAEQHAAAIRDSLRDYAAGRSGTSARRGPAGESGFPTGSLRGSPVAGSTFLDRLLDLYTRGDDLEYRQKMTDRLADLGFTLASLERERGYYQEVAGRLRTGAPVARSTAAVLPAIERQMADAVERTGRAIDLMNAVFEQLSAGHLNPPTLLYRVSGPMIQSTSPPIPWRYQAAGLITIVFGLPFLMAIALLLKSPWGDGDRRAPRVDGGRGPLPAADEDTGSSAEVDR